MGNFQGVFLQLHQAQRPDPELGMPLASAVSQLSIPAPQMSLTTGEINHVVMQGRIRHFTEILDGPMRNTLGISSRLFGELRDAFQYCRFSRSQPDADILQPALDHLLHLARDQSAMPAERVQALEMLSLSEPNPIQRNQSLYELRHWFGDSAHQIQALKLYQALSYSADPQELLEGLNAIRILLANSGSDSALQLTLVQTASAILEQLPTFQDAPLEFTRIYNQLVSPVADLLNNSQANLALINAAGQLMWQLADRLWSNPTDRHLFLMRIQIPNPGDSPSITHLNAVLNALIPSYSGESNRRPEQDPLQLLRTIFLDGSLAPNQRILAGILLSKTGTVLREEELVGMGRDLTLPAVLRVQAFHLLDLRTSNWLGRELTQNLLQLVENTHSGFILEKILPLLARDVEGGAFLRSPGDLLPHFYRHFNRLLAEQPHNLPLVRQIFSFYSKTLRHTLTLGIQHRAVTMLMLGEFIEFFRLFRENASHWVPRGHLGAEEAKHLFSDYIFRLQHVIHSSDFLSSFRDRCRNEYENILQFVQDQSFEADDAEKFFWIDLYTEVVIIQQQAPPNVSQLSGREYERFLAERRIEAMRRSTQFLKRHLDSPSLSTNLRGRILALCFRMQFMLCMEQMYQQLTPVAEDFAAIPHLINRMKTLLLSGVLDEAVEREILEVYFRCANVSSDQNPDHTQGLREIVSFMFGRIRSPQSSEEYKIFLLEKLPSSVRGRDLARQAAQVLTEIASGSSTVSLKIAALHSYRELARWGYSGIDHSPMLQFLQEIQRDNQALRELREEAGRTLPIITQVP